MEFPETEDCKDLHTWPVCATITPRAARGIFSARSLGVEQSKKPEDGNPGNEEDSVYSCSCSSCDSDEEEEEEDKLNKFQKRMLKEHKEAVAKAASKTDKINVIKERDRRKRIKTSCDHLRDLLPNFEGRKNDMASVLEMTVKYLELVQVLIPPQQRSTILSVPKELYEKWQKPGVRTQMEKLPSAQERDPGTSGRRKIRKKISTKRCPANPAVNEKQDLTITVRSPHTSTPINLPSTSVSICTEPSTRPERKSEVAFNLETSSASPEIRAQGKSVLLPMTEPCRQTLVSLATRWFADSPSVWGSQLLGVPKPMTPNAQLSTAQHSRCATGRELQSDPSAASLQDTEDEGFWGEDVLSTAVHSDTSHPSGQRSASPSPEGRSLAANSALHVLDLDQLMSADGLLAQWAPELEPPLVAQSESSREEEGTVADLFLFDL
eukprot:gi/632969237/ref/XP_007900979.1/ PREDICTED: spermatogenesis- and oogenesis-specific basic helix-loop-helix-containing protein 1 [Callorhinchus milii]